MREAEYATEKHAMVHIVLSLLIMGGVAYYYIESGYYPVSYTHLRAHETEADLVCRLLLEKKNF